MLDFAFDLLFFFTILLDSEVFHFLDVQKISFRGLFDGIPMIYLNHTEDFFISFNLFLVYHFLFKIQSTFLSKNVLIIDLVFSLLKLYYYKEFTFSV